jgi:cephalosporin hydroxylase
VTPPRAATSPWGPKSPGVHLGLIVDDPGRPVEERLDQPIGGLWMERVARHMHDVYAGVPMSKFPEDLRVYEHLLWDMRADGVIELGTRFGGGALWFRDRLRTLAGYGVTMHPPHVITVDLDVELPRDQLAGVDPAYEETITLIAGDITDPGLPEEVGRHLRPGARYLVSEDLAHTYETTSAALSGFAEVVPLGGYMVIEDGCVDIERMRYEDDWPRGVLPALDDWLESPEGARFDRRRDLELYGITCHPGGFLQRTRP